MGAEVAGAPMLDTTVVFEAVPQVAFPAAQGESVPSKTWIPESAQLILELLHWLSLSVSFIDCVVSRTICTL